MNNYLDLSDNEFEVEFRDCTLSPALFSHEAHIRLAWLHIKKYGEETAIENICNQLTKFVIMAGAKDKYNATLTIASVKIVNHFVKKSTSDNFSDFILEFPELITNFKKFIHAHYKE